MIRPLLILLAFAAACGNSSTGNELTGQVKKVIRHTPIVCSDYWEADISLGVMRNGVGSMSHEDISLTVSNPGDVAVLKQAADTGAIVRVTYDKRRFSPCVPFERMTSIVIEDTPKPGAPPDAARGSGGAP